MSSDFGQMERTLYNYEEDGDDESLFPYPEKLIDYHFSLNKAFNLKERSNQNMLQVEFQLLSAIEFKVQISHSNSSFDSLVLKSHKNLKYERNPKHPNLYIFNVKHYIYVVSKVKYLHENVYITVNYNHFDRIFIKVLMKNIEKNDNILNFIQNPMTRKTIIDSLKSDPKFKNSMNLLSTYDILEDLEEYQLIGFYMAVVRNGKCILADRERKSLTALTIMTYFRDDWPLVIVCDKKRKNYWSLDVFQRFKCSQLFRINVADKISEIYVYPKPFPHILIIDYDLYYEVKDTISFKCLNINAFIFEDQSRGHNPSNPRQWKGLSNCVQNLQRVKRIIFISAQPYDPYNCKRFWPLLQILDSNTFEDFRHFAQRYFEPPYEEDIKDEQIRDQITTELQKEFQILLRSTFLISD